MTDHSEQGEGPAEDAAVADLPTVDEVLERQDEEFPEQARTAMRNRAPTVEELAVLEAGGDPVASPHDMAVEGPNSA